MGNTEYIHAQSICEKHHMEGQNTEKKCQVTIFPCVIFAISVNPTWPSSPTPLSRVTKHQSFANRAFLNLLAQWANKVCFSGYKYLSNCLI